MKPVQSGRACVLMACLLATFMAAIEGTIVATAMPGVVADLGGFNRYSWVFSAFLLAQTVSIPVFGRLSDAYGRKVAFRAGTSLFVLGSALCGFAPSIMWLIGFRVVQGIGAGGVQPIVMTICGDLYSPVERAMVQGLVSSVFGVAAVGGPLLGVALVDHGAWPVVFWIAIPIGIASIAGVELFLSEQIVPQHHQVDYAGAALLAVSASALLLLLVEGGGLPRWAICAAIAVGIPAAIVLGWHELHTPQPMLPVELLRQRMIGVGCLANAAVSSVMMAISAFLPAYVQSVMGGTALAGGLVLGAMSLTWAAASVLTGQLMRKGNVRNVAVLGALALVAGSLVLASATPAWGLAATTAGSLVVGAGMGLCNTVLIVSIQASVGWGQRGAATSAILFARFIGQVLGVASFGAVLNATLLKGASEVVFVEVPASLDQALRGTLRTADQELLLHFVATGMRNGYWMAVALSAAALLIVILLPGHLAGPLKAEKAG